MVVKFSPPGISGRILGQVPRAFLFRLPRDEKFSWTGQIPGGTKLDNHGNLYQTIAWTPLNIFYMYNMFHSEMHRVHSTRRKQSLVKIRKKLFSTANFACWLCGLVIFSKSTKITSSCLLGISTYRMII